MKNGIKKYIDTINSLISTNDYYILDSIFYEYNKFEKTSDIISMLQYSFKTNLFKERVLVNSSNFTNYWELLSRYFLKFDVEQQKEILSVIKNIESWNQSTKNSIYMICKQYVDSTYENRVLFYEKYLIKFQLNDDYPLNEKEYLSFWLISRIKNGKYVNFDLIPDVKIEISKEQIQLFIEVFNEFSDKNYMYAYEHLMDDTVVNLLHYLIKNDKLVFECDESMPDELFQNKLFQRILMNLESSLSEKIINKLIENFNPNSRMYGKEINQFVEKYKITTERTFSDGINFFAAEFVPDLPYFEIDTFSSENDVDEVISNLKSLNSLEIEIDYPEISISGQKKELLKKINTEDNWLEIPELINRFLKYLINDENLFFVYKSILPEFIKTGAEVEMLNLCVIDEILDTRMKQSLNVFDFDDRDLFNELLIASIESHESESKKIIRYLFTRFSPNNCIVDKNKFISNNDFFYSSIYPFFDLIKKHEEFVLRYSCEEFRDIINKFGEQNIVDFLIGVFQKFYSTEELKEYCDSDSFLYGFSMYYYLGINNDLLPYLKELVLNIFQQGLDENIGIHNMIIVLITQINPLDKEITFDINSDMQNRFFLSMIDIYFDESSYKLQYLEDWIKIFFYKGFSQIEVVNKLLLKVQVCPEQKFNFILGQIEHCESIQNHNKALNLISILIAENLDEVTGIRLVNLLTLLYKKNYLSINQSIIYFFNRLFEKFADLNLKNSGQLLKEFLRNCLLENDYKTIVM